MNLQDRVTMRDLRGAIGVLNLMPEIFGVIEPDKTPDPVVMWVFKTASEKLTAMLEILEADRS